MTTDEQEAQSIRYACKYHIAVLRSGNLAFYEKHSHVPKVIGDVDAIARHLRTLRYEPPAAPKRREKLSSNELDDILKGLL